VTNIIKDIIAIKEQNLLENYITVQYPNKAKFNKVKCTIINNNFVEQQIAY
jgi:hypothetical protein